MYAHMTRRRFTSRQAAAVAAVLHVDFDAVGFQLEDLRLGMEVELEHGARNPLTNVTNDDPVLTGKLALAHLMGCPDYYVHLAMAGHGV